MLEKLFWVTLFWALITFKSYESTSACDTEFGNEKLR